MRGVRVAAIALGTAAFNVLLIAAAVRFPVPLLSSPVVLIGETAVALLVSWYLGSRGFAFGWVLVTFYVARLFAAAPLALLLHEDVFATLVPAVTLSAYSPATGLNLPSATFTVLSLLLVGAVGFHFGTRHVRAQGPPAEQALQPDAQKSAVDWIS